MEEKSNVLDFFMYSNSLFSKYSSTFSKTSSRIFMRSKSLDLYKKEEKLAILESSIDFSFPK